MAKSQGQSWRSEVDVPERAPKLSLSPMGWVDYAVPALVGLALITVVGLSAYVIAPWIRPEVLSGLPLDWPSLNSNIVSGLAFFWLEVTAVVVGVQMFQDFRAKARIRRKFHDILISTQELIAGLETARFNFAVALDASATLNGGYRTGMGALNSLSVRMKHDFLTEHLSDIRLTDHSRLLIDRVLRIMDRMTEETYDLYLGATELNDVLVAAAPDPARIAAPSDTDGEVLTRGEDLTSEAVRDPALEKLLIRLLDVTDPSTQGLLDLRNQISGVFTTLGLGKKLPTLDDVAR